LSGLLGFDVLSVLFVSWGFEGRRHKCLKGIPFGIPKAWNPPLGDSWVVFVGPFSGALFVR
ncbi:hypothetical protein ACIOG4_37415, partial [Streptomyces microflavus]|uniref:hypothetical protein n=1 Tax=Streptomyces microflavus TaxID=1919 RepID=UPI00380DCDC2